MFNGHMFLLLLLSLITNATSKCEIKAAYVKLNELVIGKRSHEAMKYAMSDFNKGNMKNMDELFPNLVSRDCKMSLQVYNAEANGEGSVKAAEEMVKNFYSHKITSPITLAMQYSGLSMAISDTITEANLAQFSGFATNPALTDYPHFFRNIASDVIQTQALIKLCNKMGWKNIGLFHMTSGAAFKDSLTQYGQESNVKVTPFEFVEEAKDVESITAAVDAMEKSELTIFVLQAYDADLEIMIDAMLKNGMIKENGDWFPYYFLGYDGFLDSATIAGNKKIRKYLSGTVGTCQSAFSEFDAILDVHPEFVQKSKSEAKALRSSADETNVLISRHGDYVNDMLPYGYDQITTLLLATEQYITKHGDEFLDGNLENYVEEIDGLSVFTKQFTHILKKVKFNGITGDVAFDKKGDRKNGLVAYCNFRGDKYNTIGFYLDGQKEAIIDTDVILYNPSYIITPSDKKEADVPPVGPGTDSSYLITVCIALLIFGFIFMRR